MPGDQHHGPAAPPDVPHAAGSPASRVEWWVCSFCGSLLDLTCRPLSLSCMSPTAPPAPLRFPPQILPPHAMRRPHRHPPVMRAAGPNLTLPPSGRLTQAETWDHHPAGDAPRPAPFSPLPIPSPRAPSVPPSLSAMALPQACGCHRQISAEEASTAYPTTPPIHHPYPPPPLSTTPLPPSTITTTTTNTPLPRN